MADGNNPSAQSIRPHVTTSFLLPLKPSRAYRTEQSQALPEAGVVLAFIAEAVEAAIGDMATGSAGGRERYAKEGKMYAYLREKNKNWKPCLSERRLRTHREVGHSLVGVGAGRRFPCAGLVQACRHKQPKYDECRGYSKRTRTRKSRYVTFWKSALRHTFSTNESRSFNYKITNPSRIVTILFR